MKHQSLKLELSSRPLNTSMYLFNKKKLKKLEISQHSHVLRCEETNYAFVYLHMCIKMPNTYAEYIQRVDKTDYHKKHENMHLMELLDTSSPDCSILV